MPDITKCKGEGCSLASKCYRFLCPPSKYNQAYFMQSPNIDDSCEQFYPVQQTQKFDQEHYESYQQQNQQT